MAVVSNADGRVRALLEAAGVTPGSSSWSTRRRSGLEKPDPRIFHAGDRAAGPPPGRLRLRRRHLRDRRRGRAARRPAADPDRRRPGAGARRAGRGARRAAAALPGLRIDSAAGSRRKGGRHGQTHHSPERGGEEAVRGPGFQGALQGHPDLRARAPRRHQALEQGGAHGKGEGRGARRSNRARR